MANYPSQLRERDELNLRLGIKSSLSQLRSVIASLYVIYVANDKQAQVTYSKESINGSLTSIKLEDNLAQQIDAKFPVAEKISSLVNKTPLFTAQLEALQVGIELFFHLAKINFVASGLSERTGSSRFQKKLAFATNMILVDLYLSSHSNEDVNKLLAAWLEDKPFASKLEDGLKMLLNTFTEETQYKIRDNNLDEIIFNQEGVYDTVLNEGEAISKDGNEPVGPFRIYKSYVASGMHPYLIEQKQEFKLNESVSRADLENYAQLVSTALDITPRKTTIEREVEQPHKQQQSSYLLLFQSNNPKDFVWGTVKALHKEGVFRELFDSKWKKRWYNNYILINDCYVACTSPDGTDGDTIGMYDDEFLNDKFRVDGRILDVKKFAKAVNDVYADRYKVVVEEDNFKLIKLQNQKQIIPQIEVPAMTSQDYQYMAAIKTKPFLILGGFSGTGKSIAVKSLAFATCPCDGYLNASETTPGNYLLLSVKPNWHDATEITGFRSSVNHNYYVTDFMKFVIKAKMYEDQNVPFFVCLDEMNLAPVEEYFADFLSVIESRTKRKDGRIVTDPLISKSVFNDSNYADDFNIFLELGIHPTIDVTDLTDFNAQLKASDEDAFYQEQWLVDELKERGMTIPQNLIVIGTVNMDDTTNSFSRKVIDRAMTFETVVGEFDVDDYFADGSGILMEYCQKPSKGELYISDEVRATDLDNNYLNDKEKKQIIDFINNINKDLDGTPFQISYRILNETILLYRSKKEIDRIIGSGFELGVEFSLDLNNIFDDILMQKILPRIEGDYDKCHTAIENLSRRAQDSEWKRSIEKLEFMERRFGQDKSGFTSFWN